MKMFIINVILMALTIPAVCAANNSGECAVLFKKNSNWKGVFIQEGKEGQFMLSLSPYSAVSGFYGTSEEKDIRPGMTGTVSADWTGKINGKEIDLIKVYRVESAHPIRYFGVCNKNNNSVSGDWMIDIINRGKFLITVVN